MFNNLVKIIAIVAIFSLHSVTQASWGTFKQCARTQLIHFNGTIAQAATETPALSTLLGALQATGLDSALAGEGTFTVFAPTNDAFANIPEPILDALLADTEILSAILLYHVLDRKVDPRRNYLRRNAETLIDQKLYFSRNGGYPVVNQSNINCKGVRTNNGTVWLIDSVLLPQF